MLTGTATHPNLNLSTHGRYHRARDQMRPMTVPEIPRDALDRLRRLAGFIPDLENAEFDIGHWSGGERLGDGSISMPYYEYSDQAHAIIAALPVIVGFDWNAWMATPRAQELVADHDRVASASVEELVRLTTAIVRSDRFNEGSVAGAFESGLLLAVARRAAVLSA